MNELALSDNLAQIELEINHHKQIAGQSIWEIGRRLNHVKENDLVHGQFTEWVEKQGINYREANRMMTVAKQLPNLTTLSDLGTSALYLIATLPESEKHEQIERIENGDNPTVRELQEVRRQLNQAKADLEEKTAQNERLAELALQKEEPQVIEKEIIKEVVPDDYESTKQLNQTLLNKNKEIDGKLKKLEWELNSKELELSTLQLESKRAIEITDQIRHLEGQKDKLETLIGSITNLSDITQEVEDFFDNKMAPLRFKQIISEVNAHYSVKEVQTMVNTVQAWCDEMYKIIPTGNRKIIDEVIIND
uniref:DUF3102 domain-containing protein n=1 Tax=Streptococcus pluranimalium TaxID=82348 RepID=UPI003F692050